MDRVPTGINLIKSFQTSEDIHGVFLIGSSYGQAAALRRKPSVLYLASLFSRGYIFNEHITSWFVEQINSTKQGHRVPNFYSIAGLLAALSIVDNDYATQVIDNVANLKKYSGFTEIGRLAESLKEFRKPEIFTQEHLNSLEKDLEKE